MSTLKGERDSEVTQAIQDSELTEDAVLALLSRRDTSSAQIEELACRRDLLTSRKVLLAIGRHMNTPRKIAIPLVRQMFAFELMQIALTPAIAADIKLLAEECLVAKLPSTTLGERLTLAKQGSSRVAAALLADSDARVRNAALDNPRMTEMFVVRSLIKPGISRALVEAIRRHGKWAVRIEVKRALEALDNPRGRGQTNKQKTSVI